MSKENKPEPGLFDAFDELLNMDEIVPPPAVGVEDGFSFDLSQELAEIIATFTPAASTPAPTPQKNTVKRTEPINSDAAIVKRETTHVANRSTFPRVEKTHDAGKKANDIGKRKDYRHLLHWRVAIVNKGREQNDIYHGRTHDISLSGVSILLDRNISFTSEVIVLLAVPPVIVGQKETILEVQCSTMYTLLDSEHDQFRLGMKFIQFKGEGKIILTDIISKRPIPINEANPYTKLDY